MKKISPLVWTRSVASGLLLLLKASGKYDQIIADALAGKYVKAK